MLRYTSVRLLTGMREDLFGAIDENGDGCITIDEFINYQRLSADA
jgi:hypothetical protein